MSIFTLLKGFNFESCTFVYCDQSEFLSLLKKDVIIHEDEKRLQEIQKDFLWHVSLPTMNLVSQKKASHAKTIFDFVQYYGKGIKIAVLDTESDCECSATQAPAENVFREDSNDCFSPKINDRKRSGFFDVFIEPCQKRLPDLTKKSDSFFNLIKNCHGEVTCNVIKQISLYATIIHIPIMDKQGFGSKQQLYEGLKKALDMHVDIVHLGLKCASTLEEPSYLDQQITAILKKFAYVVSAAGNEGVRVKELAYPACLTDITLSVGAFSHQKDCYSVCEFSQFSKNKLPLFLMPGVRILCPVWCHEISEYIFIHVSGTSVAAALMTGCLALILAEFKGDFTKNELLEVIQQFSKKLDKTWNTKVLFGTIDLPKTMAALFILKEIQQKIHLKKHKKNFKKILQIIKIIIDEIDIFDKNFIAQEDDKQIVKKLSIYAECDFHKKIDRDLCLLVQDSIYALKESIWEKKYI